MSEIMMGVLRMPSDLFWADDEITRHQHDQIRIEAADEIDRLRARLDNIDRACLVRSETDAPDWATEWQLGMNACRWSDGEGNTAPAPNMRPDIARPERLRDSPITIPIIDC